MGFKSRRREASREIRGHLGPVAERMAVETRREITSLMRQSNPSGEEYPHPEGGTYQASAPGEPPAVRTGSYLESYGNTGWSIVGSRAKAAVTSDEKAEDGGPMWAELEYGTQFVAPRLHVRPSAEEAAERFRAAARRTGMRVVSGGGGGYEGLPPAAA